MRQRPDRIIGLKETENISRFLEQPTHSLVHHQASKIRNAFKTTPFRSRQQSKPMIFPFLIVEAKSHKAQESFSDIQTQTALPIRALLDLQHGLWSHGPSRSPKPEPLVWILAYRGSDWKIYACYRSKDWTSSTSYVSLREGGPSNYDSTSLQ